MMSCHICGESEHMDNDKHCGWIQEAEDGNCWSTGCGNAMCINDGTPSENHWSFCCYCGRPIKQFEFVDDEEE